ncbi:MAG: hypothetical protein C0522_11380 [Rhodocyclaceae bacterium]|jgi:uncharacterized membrane protein|nr:hypothetical protein [Rhodocyclaceae bacterium]
MNHKDLAIRSAIAGIVALGLTAGSQTAFAAKGDMEKCAGIAKAGKNDCGSAGNSCAGTAKTDREKDAWITVPKGTCEKIAGGMVVADAKKDMKN